MKSKFMFAFLSFLSVLAIGRFAALAEEKASSPEERSQAVKFARELEKNPFGEEAASKRKWLMEWYIKVPDITVVACDLLGPSPKSEHPFWGELLVQMLYSNGAFQIEHPDLAGDKVAVQTAGVEGALKVYEVLVKAMPQGRLPFLDELIAKRSQGGLVEYVKEKTATGCSPQDRHPLGR